MQIGSTGSSYPQASIATPAVSERSEKGPDHDNDGDEGVKTSAAATNKLPAPPPGRGGNVDMVA